jgi:hypothetical protein
MRDKPIAVLSRDIFATIQWLRGQIQIDHMDISRNLIRARDGKEYRIIQTEAQANGCEFKEYVRAPDFYTLEDVVRERIR